MNIEDLKPGQEVIYNATPSFPQPLNATFIREDQGLPGRAVIDLGPTEYGVAPYNRDRRSVWPSQLS